MEMMDISPLCYMLMEMGQYCCLYRIYRLSEAVLSVFTYNLTFPQDTDMYPGHQAGFGMALINSQYLYPDFQLLPLLGFFSQVLFPLVAVITQKITCPQTKRLLLGQPTAHQKFLAPCCGHNSSSFPRRLLSTLHLCEHTHLTGSPDISNLSQTQGGTLVI